MSKLMDWLCGKDNYPEIRYSTKHGFGTIQYWRWGRRHRYMDVLRYVKWLYSLGRLTGPEMYNWWRVQLRFQLYLSRGRVVGREAEAWRFIGHINQVDATVVVN